VVVEEVVIVSSWRAGSALSKKSINGTGSCRSRVRRGLDPEVEEAASRPLRIAFILVRTRVVARDPLARRGILHKHIHVDRFWQVILLQHSR